MVEVAAFGIGVIAGIRVGLSIRYFGLFADFLCICIRAQTDFYPERPLSSGSLSDFARAAKVLYLRP